METECIVCGRLFQHEPKPGRPPTICSPECKRIRKTRTSEESRTRTANRHIPEKYHGTSTGYAQYKCGCNKCTKWAREYKQSRRAAARAAQPPDDG